jgi:zinc/manganese transport system substrate-binding protein
LRRLTAITSVAAAAAVLASTLAACGGSSATANSGGSAVIPVVAAQNEYGDVASQIGGKYVSVSSVESDPSTDPHTYEVSPNVAKEVASAKVVIQNGLGYDDFMTKIESSASDPGRKTLNVQQLLGLPDSTPNPHLWYDPKTMPKVANALAEDLSSLQPSNAGYFKANATKFIASLDPWLAAIAKFKATYPGTTVATTEPVADYLLQAAGANNLTPFSFQADVMNGVDPSPQAVSAQNGLFTGHQVKVFVYNQQVTDSLTQGFITQANQANIPVIGAYETMPTPGYHYQSWMLAEVNALQKAIADHTSTEKL